MGTTRASNGFRGKNRPTLEEGEGTSSSLPRHIEELIGAFAEL